jgi:hypothetical protein
MQRSASKKGFSGTGSVKSIVSVASSGALSMSSSVSSFPQTEDESLVRHLISPEEMYLHVFHVLATEEVGIMVLFD